MGYGDAALSTKRSFFICQNFGIVLSAADDELTIQFENSGKKIFLHSAQHLLVFFFFFLVGGEMFPADRWN